MTTNVFADILVELERRNLKLAIAESLTGGEVSSKFVAVEVLGAVVAYQDAIKERMLDVAANLLAARGAVSAEVAIAMAAGAREHFAHAANVPIEQVVAISTTGVAGPDAQGSIAAGTVFVALHAPQIEPTVAEFHFEGDRTRVREQAAEAIANLLWDYLRP
ncbi:MAG: hypothetical protein RLZZ340_174 [Actinomycetota bacterium]